jgi:hypothetical protein
MILVPGAGAGAGAVFWGPIVRMHAAEPRLSESFAWFGLCGSQRQTGWPVPLPALPSSALLYFG